MVRIVNKAARERRALRWSLVHAAGCTAKTCITKNAQGVLENVAEALDLGVRIPRSYRDLAKAIKRVA